MRLEIHMRDYRAGERGVTMETSERHGYVKRWWKDEDGTVYEDVVIMDIELAKHILKLLQEAIAKEESDD